MARLKLSDIISDIFTDYSYVVDGLEWIFEHHTLTIVNRQEAEGILENLKEAFAGVHDKRKLNKINVFWKDANTFIGVCPAELYYPHRPSTKRKIMMIVVETDEGKINLIDPNTGEIRQRELQ